MIDQHFKRKTGLEMIELEFNHFKSILIIIKLVLDVATIPHEVFHRRRFFIKVAPKILEASAI